MMLFLYLGPTLLCVLCRKKGSAPNWKTRAETSFWLKSELLIVDSLKFKSRPNLTKQNKDKHS